MTKKRKRPHPNDVKPIPSTQLNVKQIERQLSRGSRQARASSIWKETNARHTASNSSEALYRLRKGCSSHTQTGSSSIENGYYKGDTSHRAEGSGVSKTWRPITSPSSQATSSLASEDSHLQSTPCTFDSNVNACGIERNKSRGRKGKFGQCRVGRPPKTCNRPKDQVIKLPVIPVLKISLTDVKSLNDDRGNCKGSPTRYCVTPYPFGQKCTISPPQKKCNRGRRISRGRSGSKLSCRSLSSQRKRRRRHRRRPRSRASSSRSCQCKCSCSRCQTCAKKTHQRSRSNSRQCGRSRSNSGQRKRSRSNSRQCGRSRSNSRQCGCSRSNSGQRKRSRSNSRQCGRSRSNSGQRKRSRSNSRQCGCSRSNSGKRKRSRSNSRQSKRSRSSSKEHKRMPDSLIDCLSSCSDSKERKRKKRGSPKICRRSRSRSRSPKCNKPPSRKGSPRQCPDATKTVKTILERVSNAFSSQKKCKNVSSNNDLGRVRKHESRSRSPKRQHHRKRPSTQENVDSTTMCRLM